MTCMHFIIYTKKPCIKCAMVRYLCATMEENKKFIFSREVQCHGVNGKW
jgi:hypothetical protein